MGDVPNDLIGFARDWNDSFAADLEHEGELRDNVTGLIAILIEELEAQGTELDRLRNENDALRKVADMAAQLVKADDYSGVARGLRDALTFVRRLREDPTLAERS